MTLRTSMMAAAAVAFVLTLVVIYLEGRSRGAAIEKRNTDVALAAAASANAEAQIARQVATRIDEMNRRTAQTTQITREHAIAALEAQDANAPLSDGRAARLVDADQRLCNLNSKLEGCPGGVPGP